MESKMKAVLIISVLINIALGAALYGYVAQYNTLHEWACESAGLGGYECGEL